MLIPHHCTLFESDQRISQELSSRPRMSFKRHIFALRQDGHGTSETNKVLANCQGLLTLQVLKLCNVLGLRLGMAGLVQLPA